MKEWIYRGADVALEKAIAKEIGYHSAQKAIRKREIKINGRRAVRDSVVRDGDRLTVYVEIADPLTGRIVYKDESVIVADKPRNLDTYEAAELLSGKFGTAIPVHRLDRNTAGVIIFARTEDAAAELKECFASGRAEKKYRAQVVGVPKLKEATLTAYLYKDEKSATVRVSDCPSPGFRRIVTGYRVKEDRGDTAVLDITLYTGRTHQIRAHLAHIGYPVLGDGKYGDYEANRRYNKKYQCLTCVSLRLKPKGKLAYLEEKTFSTDRID